MQQDDHHTGSIARSLRLRDFLYHFVVYLFVMAIVYIATGAGSAFIWLGLVWGFAVIMHGIWSYFG